MPNSPIFQTVPVEKREQGEHVTMASLGRHVADPLFKAHRDTWITEADIKEIASYGLNTVRVPVGWWIYEDPNDPAWESFSPGGLAYLDNLINNWAAKANVAVLVGMHAAKGSQNGEGHSAPPKPRESHFTNDAENVYATMQSALFLMNRYKSSPAFIGLEMLNEPSVHADRVYNIDRSKVKLYYKHLYTKLRSICADCVIMLSPYLSEQYESFGNEWANLLPAATNNWIDWHKYLIWGFENWNVNDIINVGTQWIANDITLWQSMRPTPVFVGEWSLATMNNAKAGWTYWSWKIDSSDWRTFGWNMQSLLRKGTIKLHGFV
ncbi:hypothetical protein SPRG_03270 [Saprolegnia parasitica CBS 223.65]|uniref:glucan 1,3-beta-glucosidase n=1 Tax=Saprolegnia parasitica (strain CBS 223.65) TaxID=695850 RepID=A0A067CZ15_SAPPC|nr:hypothetical protein SPRG_03270 [Saprolegnia parasitica CBS 223.65]KDO32052.1 hypothetical protein SPRG_03270 [Saprolegnia parasitica CBS 223.65]|eukprot:XP_012197240.1 hypothetical protein SPRG_03270 [Saprolegnia parasitica CBS 223.65]